MINLKAHIVNHLPSADKLMGQINYGTAAGVTKTAKEGQAASVKSLKSTFTLRNNWFEQNNRYGIRIKPATKRDMQAEVRTNADWLERHETGEDKHARGGRVAVPTDQVRRNKKMIIPRGQRPKGLAGKIFVLKSKRGDVLAQRLKRGKRKGLIVLYGLENTVKIKKQSTFYSPIEKVVKRNLVGNVREGIDQALRTMR